MMKRHRPGHGGNRRIATPAWVSFHRGGFHYLLTRRGVLCSSLTHERGCCIRRAYSARAVHGALGDRPRGDKRTW